MQNDEGGILKSKTMFSEGERIMELLEKTAGKAVIVRCSVEGKICYSSRGADYILNHVRGRCHSSGRRNCRGKEMPRRKYYCSACESYHLTHKSIQFSKMLGREGKAQRYRFRQRRIEYGPYSESDDFGMM